MAKGFKATQPNHEYSYGYDHNGNLIYDESKGATVTYNHLNLPREITIQSSNGIDPGGSIKWDYDATGRKLKKISPDGHTLYHNGIEKAGGGIFVYHAEGRVAFYPGNPSATPPVEDEWYYEFSMRDHLGNTRITFADLNHDGYIQANPGDWIFNDPHGSPVGYTEILQENHYYPFGMNFEGPWREPEVEGKVNRYQYNGKELNSDLGLGWYNYGARMYDPVVGRFTGVDPLANGTPSWTPYHYVHNRPVNLVDPTGMRAEKKDDGYYQRKAAYEARQHVRDVEYGLSTSERQITSKGHQLDNQEPKNSKKNQDTNKEVWPILPGYFGRMRHLMGPDAIEIGVDFDGFAAGGVDVTPIALIVLLRGPDMGKILIISDIGFGPGYDVSASGKITALYYSGEVKNLKAELFQGLRTEVNAAITVDGIDLGAGFSWAPTSDGNVYGVQYSLGLGIPLPFTVSFNQNTGYTIIWNN